MKKKENIILVGNGPSLLTSQLGTTIDSFSNIVRFNGFKIEGFEKHVGHRTTIWSRWYALAGPLPSKEVKTIWLNMPIRDRSDEKIEKAKDLIKPHQGLIEIIPDIEVATQVQIELFEDILSDKWPSSGLLAIVHAISRNYQVSIAGIDSWSHEPFHYFERHDRSGSHHSPEHERNYIITLCEKGLVNKLI